MIFYLCTTEQGQQFAPTQAEAKALDKDFVQVDVPTSKNELMAYVNELLARTASEERVQTSDEPAPCPSEWERCPACSRTRRGAELMARLFDNDAIRAVIRTCDPISLGGHVDAVIDRLIEMRSDG